MSPCCTIVRRPLQFEKHLRLITGLDAVGLLVAVFTALPLLHFAERGTWSWVRSCSGPQQNSKPDLQIPRLLMNSMSTTFNIVHTPTSLELCHNSHPDPPSSPVHFRCDADNLQLVARDKPKTGKRLQSIPQFPVFLPSDNLCSNLFFCRLPSIINRHVEVIAVTSLQKTLFPRPLSGTTSNKVIPHPAAV